MKISKEVLKALKENVPVIALESTIITHGMPYPDNVKCALSVEEEVRKNKCVPATIGFIKGEPVVGLSEKGIEYLGKASGVVKVSRRDIPLVIVGKKDGGTTVTTTMILAEKAGIKFFATGGIGGAHKGANLTFDVSSDLNELSMTSVCVTCAGPKAILDLEKTSEILETKGVPVIGYNCDVMPSFYSRKSPVKVDFNAKTPKEIAQICKEKWRFGLDGGVLVTNPIPEEFELDYEKMNKVIDKAIKEMDKKKIKGKDQTPFLLSKICDLTNGDSLKSNIQLVLNNVRLTCKVAIEYNKLK